jgi:hypothetical protein
VDRRCACRFGRTRVTRRLQGTIWAAGDPQRRASKRQKDLAGIARIMEAYPELRANVPREIVDKLP